MRSSDGALLDGIILDRDSNLSLQYQLYQGLRNLIGSGVLEPGTRLPATRSLETELQVSRTTVRLAFDQLLAEGYLQSKQGSGTFVTEQLGDQLEHLPTLFKPSSRSRPANRVGLSKRGERISKSISLPGYSQSGAFVHSVPSTDEFPRKLWRSIQSRQWSRFDSQPMAYGDLGGYWPLRVQIASYLASARGIICDPEQVIVVAGAQNGFFLAASLLMDAGESVWMEDPGYVCARGAFQCSGASIVPVPLDQNGLSIEAALETKVTPRLIYVTPSRQYPMGKVMPTFRRLEVLNSARRMGAWVLEDDYDSEFRYIGRPLPALYGLDDYGCTIYVGSFSKVLFPSLRLGYLVVPKKLAELFARSSGTILKGPPTHTQATVAEFIEAGHFARHIRRMKKIYKARHDLLLGELKSKLGNLLDVEPHHSGFHLVARVPPDVSDVAISKNAMERGILVCTLSEMSEKPLERGGLLVGFASVQEKEIAAGVIKLAKAVDSVL